MMEYTVTKKCPKNGTCSRPGAVQRQPVVEKGTSLARSGLLAARCGWLVAKEQKAWAIETARSSCILLYHDCEPKSILSLNFLNCKMKIELYLWELSMPHLASRYPTGVLASNGLSHGLIPLLSADQSTRLAVSRSCRHLL